MLYTRSLGFELTRELRASLDKDPRPYLFTESNTPRPYTHSAFAMYARRALQKLFGKPCTLTLLRHSYISHMLAYGQLTIRDREQLAAEMCHSPATQAQYQWIEPRQPTDRSSLEEEKNLDLDEEKLAALKTIAAR